MKQNFYGILIILLSSVCFPERIYSQMSQKDQDNMKEAMNLVEPYSLGADSKKQEGVLSGTLKEYSWNNSEIYPNTQRKFIVYTPAGYDPGKPACLLIVQDGTTYYMGTDIDIPTTLDNLIKKNNIPFTIAVFIAPHNRSSEYNSVTDTYARFLIEEIIPEIKKSYTITDDPKGRILMGFSSGGICAFNAAWHRPDAFGNVISHCGSFVNIMGGDKYPEIVRQGPKKPIRVFLQSGEKDLNLIWGHWPTRNIEMAEALKYAEYDYRFVFGAGGHSLKQAGEIFPETLCWIWRDFK